MGGGVIAQRLVRRLDPGLPLITAANGDLVAVMDERVASCSDLNDNKDINIVMRRRRFSNVETPAPFRRPSRR